MRLLPSILTIAATSANADTVTYIVSIVGSGSIRKSNIHRQANYVDGFHFNGRFSGVCRNGFSCGFTGNFRY
jgi:hypothetical protein